MGYLDSAGLEHFWGKIKENLPGPRGPAGPDGNPIGTIISFMGTSAPDGYLVCDGAVHNISDYPALAALFAAQFGAANHFGGDGTSTFAVPDMRNLFLRGWHGEAEEPLSGDIGQKQEATKHSNFVAHPNGVIYAPKMGFNPASSGSNVETLGEEYLVAGFTPGTQGTEHQAGWYTSRPVNMAVLYCIKAVKSAPVLEEYDTADGWHVRKWSDGYASMTGSFVYTLSGKDSYGGVFMYYGTRIDIAPPSDLVEIYSFSVELDAQKNNFNGWLMQWQGNGYGILTGDTSDSSNGKPATVLASVTGRWK